MCSDQIISKNFSGNKETQDFPGGPVLKNLPWNAGITGSIPRQGTKIPHVSGKLSLRAAITEPACLEPMIRNKRNYSNETPAHCKKEWPPLTATRESLRPATKTQCSQKKEKEIQECTWKYHKLPPKSTFQNPFNTERGRQNCLRQLLAEAMSHIFSLVFTWLIFIPPKCWNKCNEVNFKCHIQGELFPLFYIVPNI